MTVAATAIKTLGIGCIAGDTQKLKAETVNDKGSYFEVVVHENWTRRYAKEAWAMYCAQDWELDKARKESTTTLRDWIWAAVSAGQPIPGCLSVDSCRVVLMERGEDGSGFHNT